MTNDQANEGNGRGLPWRLLGWGGAAILMLLPVLTGAPWTGFDYALLAVLLGGAGLVLEAVARTSGDPFYRAGSLLAVAAAAGLFVVNGAIGFLGREDNPANLLFAGVIAVAALGAVLAGFRAAGLARAMLAAAAAQVAVGVVALAAGLGASGVNGLYEAVLGTSLFTSLWLVAAGLFRKAAGGTARSAR